MPPRFKLFAFALLALCAFATQAQGAPQFTGFVNEAPAPTHLGAALKGEQTSTIVYTPGVGSMEVNCSSFEMAGRAETGTDQSISIRPEPKGCSSPFRPSTDVRMNGCEYRFNVTSKGGADKYQGTMDIVCPEGRQVELLDTEVGEGGSATRCRQAIPPQEGLGLVYLEDQTEAAPDHVEVELEVSGIKNSTSGGESLCGVKDGEHANGTLSGAFTLKGYSTAAQVDFLVVGEAEPQFTAFGVAPEEGGHVTTTLEAKQAEGVEFKPSSMHSSIYCAGASATAELASGTAGQVTLPFEYSKCTDEVLPSLNIGVQIKTNGCDQRYWIEENIGEDEYTGKLAILCPAGKQIEISRNSCLIRIPAQEGIGPVLYRVRRDVAPHDLLLEPQATIKASAFGALCPPNGEFTTGSYRASLTLRGLSGIGAPINLSVGGKEPSLEFTGAPASLPSITRVATTVSGTQATTHQFVPEKGFSAISCGTASLKATSETGISSSLTAQPTYSGCATASSLTVNV
ncbi:MAG TPA: hypothetical protein VFQ06_09025, partial [Nitrospira sp.]|nr:hypothetical protein [Nitrospira sp.]